MSDLNLTTAGAPILTLENVGVRFGLQTALLRKKHKDFWALKDVSLKLYRGEALGVIGSNGAGKSTLMKVLAGIYAPDKGKLWMEKNLHVSMLSLGLGFESPLNGADNAILAGMLLGHTRKYMETRLGDIREYSELGDFFDQPIYTYSSGMLARLGFAVAMEADPEVLLIDEAMGVGDTHFQEKSGNTIAKRLSAGKTIVLISHSAKDISKICNRAVWVDRGVSIREGPVGEVMAAYDEAVQKKSESAFAMSSER